MPSCYRHPDRPTGLRCTRCDKPVCPDCMREASVGYQCLDCVNEGRRTTRRATTVAGAEFSRRLVVVPVLIVLNVVVFAINVAQAKSVSDNFLSQLFQDWQLWPPIVADGQWWRLFTNGFLHSGPTHIGFNMLALYLIGRELEPLLGKVRFTVVYLISLLGGSVAVFLFGDVNTPVAGASGAVFGLMGALLLAALRLRRNPRLVLVILGISIFFSLPLPGVSFLGTSSTEISWLGHLGGLVAGLIAGAAMLYAPARSRTTRQAVACVALVIALLGLIMVRDAQFGELSCRTQPVLECVQTG